MAPARRRPRYTLTSGKVKFARELMNPGIFPETVILTQINQDQFFNIQKLLSPQPVSSAGETLSPTGSTCPAPHTGWSACVVALREPTLLGS